MKGNSFLEIYSAIVKQKNMAIDCFCLVSVSLLFKVETNRFLFYLVLKTFPQSTFLEVVVFKTSFFT